MAKNAYSTTLTRQKVDSNTLQIDEDILFNNARVGGVRVQFDFLSPDAQKQSSFSVVSNVGDAVHLDQQVDLSYGGVKFMRLTVSAQPDPEIGHSISIDADTVQGQAPPLTVTTAILP